MMNILRMTTSDQLPLETQVALRPVLQHFAEARRERHAAKSVKAE
jgi:hypothetical protein